MGKKKLRLRRARASRAKILQQAGMRLCVFRSNCHMYAQIISAEGNSVVAAASTLEPEVRSGLSVGGNKRAAAIVGKVIAERARALGIEAVSFDRSGFRYHGRVQALAEAAREVGLKF